MTCDLFFFLLCDLPQGPTSPMGEQACFMPFDCQMRSLPWSPPCLARACWQPVGIQGSTRTSTLGGISMFVLQDLKHERTETRNNILY